MSTDLIIFDNYPTSFSHFRIFRWVKRSQKYWQWYLPCCSN